jgi:competence protein ComEA
MQQLFANSRRVASIAVLLAMPTAAWAQEETTLLPEGPGKAETLKLCRQCHELARSIAPRQDRAGWGTTLSKMTALGMKATPQEASLVLDYLVSHYPPGDVPPVNVNTARAIELESALSLRRSQAAAVIKFREQNGPFKTLDDLKKVPSIDPAKIDEKKDRIAF